MAEKREKIKQIEEEIARPEFWQNRIRAEKISRELSGLKEKVEQWEGIGKSINDCLEIARFDERDQTASLHKGIEKQFSKIEKQLNDFEKLIFLNGEYDQGNALVSIFAGAGGVDAQDWAEMLLRMYLRFAEKRGWRTQIIDRSKGLEAGIKSVVFEVEGEYAYGFLKSEAGVHRLVRISPFDAEQMRHTSFALVEVLPELDEIEEVDINPDDLKIDTFLASGHGGQNVQKNETAIRITHLPSKIAVSCQAERSQVQNKERALRILKSKLYQYAQAAQEEEKAKLRGEFKSVSWGNQIRSYVLQPYHLVKDLRTGYETNEVDKILDGDLEQIIESYLRNKKE